MPVAVAKFLLNLLASITGQQHDPTHAGLGQLIEQVSQEGLAEHGRQDLGPIADDSGPAGEFPTRPLGWLPMISDIVALSWGKLPACRLVDFARRDSASE